jgi:uncharacterized protein with HEPN domain
MTLRRLPDYLDHMREAAADACGHVAGLTKEQFLASKLVQQAVVMNIVIIGEAAARVLTEYPAFAEAHQAVPWRPIRGMRNRLAHGYFDIDLDIVWDTTQTALPALLKTLRELPPEAAEV